MSARLQALVFDAYGTLYDVHSVVEECNRLWPGQGAALSQLWRAKQLEYTWQRSLMGRYLPFHEITAAALAYACAVLKLPLTEARAAALMQTYHRLETYPEVNQALVQLHDGGKLPLAILSNGSPQMLEPLVESSGLLHLIGDVISVDSLRIYKPAPRVYQLAVDRLELEREDIGFVSSNCWDACGAKSFGFQVFWVNRAGAPVDALGAAPDHIIGSLAELPELVRA